MFCDSNYATGKETIKSVDVLVDTLGGKLLIFFSKTLRNIKLSSIEAEYVAVSACAQEVKCFNMLLEEIT